MIAFSMFRCMLQFCSTGAGTNKRDVVRVAPKINHTNGTPHPYSYNLANSFPASYSTNSIPHHAVPAMNDGAADAVNTANNPSFQITSMNYTSFPTTNGHPHEETPTDHQLSDHIIHSDTFVSADFAAAESTASHTKARHNRNGFLSAATASAFNPFPSRTKAHKKPTAAIDQRFSSLKSGPVSGCRRTSSDVFHSMRSNGGSVAKCKRHHSFVNDRQTSTLSYTVPRSAAMLDGDDCNRSQQPLYENLTDSIQIHEASLPLDFALDHSDMAGGIGLPLADADVLDLELQQRHSLYRSDSGISNSSYECVTPVPAPRRNPRKCQSVPVYMNLPGRGRSADDGGGVAAGDGVRSSKRCRGSAGKGPGPKCSRDGHAPVYSYEVGAGTDARTRHWWHSKQLSKQIIV